MSEWIKCSERLPEFAHDQLIVAYEFNGRLLRKVACMDFDKSWYCPISYDEIAYVTHWTPLPPAPEEE